MITPVIMASGSGWLWPRSGRVNPNGPCLAIGPTSTGGGRFIYFEINTIFKEY